VIIGRKIRAANSFTEYVQFPLALDENAAVTRSIPCRLAGEMYRFRAQVVPFGDKELDWRTGWQLN
jgi:hypothetical protein